jgi:plasmid stability protein
MADLILDDVPADLVEALERRAASHGRSPEDEHRLILTEALRSPGANISDCAAPERGNTVRKSPPT